MRSNPPSPRLHRRVAGAIPRAVIAAGIAVAVATSCNSHDSAGPPSSGSPVTAPPMSPAAPATAPGPDRTAPGQDASAGGEPAPPPVDAPRTSAGSGEPPAAEPRRPGLCEDSSVDDMVAQAQNQYTAGFSKPALQLMTRALECRQDGRMYRFAATYACAAHDAASAKRWSAKVPPQFQIAIVQRCQQEGITLP